MKRQQKPSAQSILNQLEIDKLKLENQKLKKENRKLDLECEKLSEEIIAIKIKRRVLVVTLFFTGIGLFIQMRK